MITGTVRRGCIIAILFGTIAAICPYTAAVAAPSTIVSITIDDGLEDAMTAAEILDRHGMRGTFYINSGTTDTPGHLTRDQVIQLVDQGHEIGGHSVLHPDLTTVSVDEARREVCLDRQNLLNWGLRPISFAYPFGSANAATEHIAAACGYDNARIVGDLASKSPLCRQCPAAESLLPLDKYRIRTSDDIDPTWTLSDIEGQVTSAMAAGGGWIPLVLHSICDGCSSIGFEPTVLEKFLDWLSTQQSFGVHVETVGEVVGGPLRPVPRTSFAMHSTVPPLTSPTSDGIPACWNLANYGRNTVAHDVQLDPLAGSAAIRITMRNHVDGNAKLLPDLDLGECSPSAAAGARYKLSMSYTSDVQVQIDVYYRNSVGRWIYWTSSPYLAASPSWRLATWVTPPAPSDATGISFGLAIAANGSLTLAASQMTPSARTDYPEWVGWCVVAGTVALVILPVLVRRNRKRLSSGPRSVMV